MGVLWQDLRYGLRTLLKRPVFTLIAVLTLALGIGANTAIFSVVNAVLLRPLPYPEPERLVQVWETRPQQAMRQIEMSPAEFIHWREQNKVFEEIAVIDVLNYNMTGRDEPERIVAARVSAGYFDVLGVRPALGRAFLAEEDQPGSSNVVVLNHELWQTRFGADPGVVNQTVSLNGSVCAIVGVMPAGFELPGGALLARPIAFRPEDRDNTGNHYLTAIARLKSGVTIERAGAEMDAIAVGLEQTFPATIVGHRVVLVPLREQLVGGARASLLVLLGAVGCVLLIACANVANLLLARAASRRREMAVRAALGASRWRIVRQLLTESLLLAFAGGVAGLLLAWWGVDLLLGLSPDAVPRAREIGIDPRVLGFTLALTALTGTLFGLAPALQASKLDLNEALKEGDRGSTEGFRRNRLRGLLVVSEVALTLMLLVGAGLLVKSFVRLREVNPGFNAENLLTADLSLPSAKYTEPQKTIGFYRELLERVEAQPGVRAAGAVSVLPLGGDDVSSFIFIEGHAPLPPGEARRAGRRIINPEYFAAMGIPLKSGRVFADTDADGATPVVIVNETFARTFLAGEEPTSKRIRTNEQGPWLAVVGVAGDVKHNGLGVDARPEIYFSYLQNPARQMTLAVRTEGDAAALAGALREQVRALDKEQPVGSVRTMRELLARSVASQRFSTLLLGVFAGVATLLAVVGIYGVMSYSVARRTHELGIRMALGAQGRDVLRLVVGQGMRLTLAGVSLGFAAALALTRVMEGLLFGVSATDPAIFASVSLLLLIVALVACYVPARRATKVDPMVALRYE